MGQLKYEITDKQAVTKLIALLAKYRWTICVIIVSLIFSTGLNFCVPLISRRIMDDGFIAGDVVLLIKLAVASFIIYLLIISIDVFTERLRINLSAKLQYRLNEEAFNHLIRVRMDYYDKRNYAETFSNLNMDISNMNSVADEGMFIVITQIFSIIGGIIGLFTLDYRMTIIVLAFIPIKYVVINWFAKKRKSLMDSYIELNRDYAGWFGDTVGGVRDVRLLGLQHRKRVEFAKRQKNLVGTQKKINMLSQWNMSVDSFMIHILALIIYIVGADLVFSMRLTVGTVFAFITYSAYVTGPISAILNIKYLLSGIVPSTKRYYEFLSVPEEEGEIGNEISCWEEISFNDVTFSYNEGDIIIDGVNIRIPKRQKVAIVGRNGCGKSTLIELLLRLRKPQKGSIRIGNIEIDNLPMMSYRELFAVVSQDVYLFNDSIRNNVCLYREVDEAVLAKACEDSGLAEFLKEVTLDYNVGQNGAMLSGGQKQKVALARALVLDRPIIILDEATSNVDSFSEQRVNQLLHTRFKDKTVIVISHHKSVLEEMDQLILMSRGKVIKIGNFNDISCTQDYQQLMEEIKLPNIYG